MPCDFLIIEISEVKDTDGKRRGAFVRIRGNVCEGMARVEEQMPDLTVQNLFKDDGPNGGYIVRMDRGLAEELD